MSKKHNSSGWAFLAWVVTVGGGWSLYIQRHGYDDVSLKSYIIAIVVAWMLLGVFAAISSWIDDRRDKEAEAARKAREEAEQRAKDREQRQREIVAKYGEIQAICTRSVAAFEELPANLAEADKRMLEARDHFENAAYSPYWSAIEGAYVALGDYNRNLEMIGDLSRRYATDVQHYRAQGGRGSLPAFPVDLEAASATEAVQEMAVVLEEMVYRAHRDAVFAQIWEQRRTTAAVIAGFATLEAAVDRMSGTLSSAISSLGGDLRALSSKVGDVSGEIREAAARGEAISRSQLVEQRHLSDRMAKAVYYLKEEHRRAIGMP